MKFIKSFKDIIDKYDVFIIDQWGVMHDGIYGYKHAIKSIDYLKTKNKKLIIVSNSSKRKESSIKKLPSLGFRKDNFENLITSGEMIWKTISLSLDKYGKGLKKCFHIYDDTKEDGIEFRNNLTNIDFVENINEADFILACTPFAKSQPLDYVPILNIAYEKNMLMFCANPDFETIDKNDNNIFCIGTISEMYKFIGGNVIIKGKPSKDIYIEATNKLQNINKTKMLAIGDSIFHDIDGANKFGIDSLLIASGIHKEYFADKTSLENKDNKLFKYNIFPTYLSYKFS